MDQNAHIYISQLNYKGDIVGTMDYSNTDIERHTYTSFGQTDDDNFVSPYGFSGEYTDVETGHQYLRNRYYDPATSRFTQEDNNFIDGFNLYAYCVNDPINYTDPSGNCCGFPMNWNTEVTSQPHFYMSAPGNSIETLCKDYEIHKQLSEGLTKPGNNTEIVESGQILTPEDNVGKDTLFIKSIELTPDQFEQAFDYFIALDDMYNSIYGNRKKSFMDVKHIIDIGTGIGGAFAKSVPVLAIYGGISSFIELIASTTSSMNESYEKLSDILKNIRNNYFSLHDKHSMSYELVHVRTPYMDQLGIEVKFNTAVSISKKYVVNFSLNADLIESAFNEIIRDMDPKWSLEKGLPNENFSLSK